MKTHLVVGGRNSIEAAAAADALKLVYVTPDQVGWAERLGVDKGSINELPAAKMKSKFGDEFRQGVVGQVVVPESVSMDVLVDRCCDGAGPIVVLEEVQDPQNVGSIFRAAAALGAAGVVVTKNRSADLTAAVVRASVGCLFRVPYALAGGIPNLLQQVIRSAGLQTIATLARDGDQPRSIDMTLPTALVLGAEGHGLKRLTQERCEVKVTIPMDDAESLNVAQTATALLYEAGCQRRDTRRP